MFLFIATRLIRLSREDMEAITLKCFHGLWVYMLCHLARYAHEGRKQHLANSS